jgi:hypothetical protein
MGRVKHTWMGSTLRLVAGTLSAGGALVSILSYGGGQWEVTGGKAQAGSAEDRVHRLVVTPARDTATAIGDSLQLAATVTDDRGAVIPGVPLWWTSADPGVAEVDQAGTVVSRGPGVTAIIVRVGGLESRARVAVVQRATALRFADTVLQVPEGERLQAVAEVVDGRGHRIAGAPVRWESADAALTSVDSAGVVTGVSPGRSSIAAGFEELRAVVPVEVTPVAASITVAGGEDQRAAVGEALPAPVVGQVVSRTGRPIPGAVVAFVTRGGQGSVLPARDTADGRGMVQAVWTLGPVPGRQQLSLSVEGLAVSPVLSAEADPLPANTRVALVGEPPTAAAGDSVPEPVVVRITDTLGTALGDLPVRWTAVDRGAAIALGARTDSLGEARVRWVLGPRAGRQRLGAQVGNARLMPVFTVTGSAVPGNAASLVVRRGDRQTGTVGQALAQPVLLRAFDRSGNTVPGVEIAVTVTGGEVSDSVVSTDSSGHARVRWTLGRTAGAQRLSARFAGAKAAVEVSARARPGAPASLAFVGPPASAPVGRALPKPIMVEAADVYGNPSMGRTIVFSVSSGTVSPAKAVTDSSGRVRVRWTLGRRSGSARLTAQVLKSELRKELEISTTGR